MLSLDLVWHVRGNDTRRQLEVADCTRAIIVNSAVACRL